ncbi:MAG: J domain-containing protein [Pseudomonadota bacterium]
MLKFAIILAVVCLLWRWALGTWPWEALRSKPTRSQAIFKARKLLGVEEGANHEQIKAAHKRLIAMVHPDRGGSSSAVHEANAARDLLLDELPDKGAAIRVDANGDDSPRDPSQDPPQD